MKDSAFLINTSRADIVDENSLAFAINFDLIKGYATDFRDKNYIKFHVPTDRIITTPHIGGNTVESRKKTDMYIARQIIKYKEAQND